MSYVIKSGMTLLYNEWRIRKGKVKGNGFMEIK